MSITFQVEASEPTSYDLVCFCENSVSLKFDSYTAANSFLLNSIDYRLEGCEDDYCYQLFLQVQFDTSELPSLNMSNSNAGDVLEVLGVDVRESEYAGIFEADDLLARINIALAVAPESAERLSYSENNVVMCGRNGGYVQDRLAELITVAEHAKEMERAVIWS